MKAMIIYDSFAAGAKASAILKGSTEDLAFDVQWNVCPWRLDMLRFSPTLDLAMAEALDAHLIVLAGQLAQPLPTFLFKWLEHWAKNRNVGEAAIAVYGIAKGRRYSPSTASCLAGFAKRCGLGLLCVDADEGGDVRTVGVCSVREVLSGKVFAPRELIRGKNTRVASKSKRDRGDVAFSKEM